MRAFRIIIFLFVTSLAVAAQKTDVVIMKNGDRLTCEIVKLTDGVLNVKLDYVQDTTISLQWAQVSRIESTRLFIVKTEAGSVFTGKLSTVDPAKDQPVKIEVAETPDRNVELSSEDVVSVRTNNEKFLDRLNGDISLGLSYSKGNQTGRYNLDASVEYPRERWSAKASFASYISFDSGSRTFSRHHLSMSGERMLPRKNFFYTGRGNLYQSTEQGINLQTNFGGGIGYYIKNTSRFRFSVTGGVGLQRTVYNLSGAGLTTQNAAAGIISTELRFAKFKKTSFDLEASLLPFINDPGRFHFSLSQKYYIKLFGNLSWNIRFYGDWDNKPPLGLPGSDYGSSVGMGWIFGDR